MTAGSGLVQAPCHREEQSGPRARPGEPISGPMTRQPTGPAFAFNHGGSVANRTDATKLHCFVPRHARQPGILRDVLEWRHFAYDPALFRPMTHTELAEDGWE